MSNIINKNNKFIIRLIYYTLGLFIASFIYNAIFVPNNIVTGGVSGLAIVIKELTGLNTTIFIDITNVVLVIVCYFVLGKKETIRQLFGCIFYPLMVTFTAPLANLVTIKMNLTVLILFSILYGIANGIIYRAGFTTGGADIIIQIISNKTQKSITTVSPILNIIIIILGGIVFKPVEIIHAISVIYISNKIANGILYSLMTNKMVYVISKKNKDIEEFILNGERMGSTEMRVHSGLFEKKKQMLMCIIHNSQYAKFKYTILSLDPKAFIITKNCYEVTGGIKYTILPF